MEPLFCPSDLIPGPLETFRNGGVSDPWSLGWGDDSVNQVLCLWVSMIHMKVQLWWPMPVIQGSENGRCKVKRSIASWWASCLVRDCISKYKVERSRGSLCPHTRAHTHRNRSSLSSSSGFHVRIRKAPRAGRCGVDCYRALLFQFHTSPHSLQCLSSEDCVQQSRVSSRSSAVYVHTHTSTPFLVPMLVSEDNQV